MVVPARAEAAAVRAYLSWLDDPASALDPAEVTAAEEAVDAAADAVERVLALTRLERAIQVDEDALRAGFIEHAAGWCKRTGATASALRQFGVPVQVLLDAGLDPPTGPAGDPRRRRAVPAAVIVDIETITGLVPRDKPFRAAEFAILIGRHVSTARNHLARLIDLGRVEEVGPDPTWLARGKTPVLYQWVGGESGI